MKTKAKDLFAGLPFEFGDKALLRTVFVHSSYLNEKEAIGAGVKESYERLEFLGDSILSAAVSHLLYERYPGAGEGELTRMRARLVNRKTLAGVARTLGLGEKVLLGRGEIASGGAENPTILAGVFEALLGAIYLDIGHAEAFAYVEGLFSPLMVAAAAEPGHFDYKPRLQELCQRIFKEAPSYRVVGDVGPPHRKTFEVEAVVGGRVIGRAAASRKKDAEQAAASEALVKLSGEYPEEQNRA